MRLLLDTHVLIWAINDDKALKRGIRDAIADRDNELLFSVVSIWEIVIKNRAGKLHLDWRKLAAAASSAGFRRVDLALPHVDAFEALPLYHRDPFDHMLIAQAIAEEAALVTADRYCQMYPVELVRA